jgi:hypothetical protein
LYYQDRTVIRKVYFTRTAQQLSLSIRSLMSFAVLLAEIILLILGVIVGRRQQWQFYLLFGN